MNNIDKRFYLFLIGCVGTRILFAYLAKTVSVPYLKWMGWVAILPAIGFLYFYMSGTRKTGIEVFGDKIWWNNLRPIHSFLYAMFAYNAIRGNKQVAWIYLALDVSIGIIAFSLNKIKLI